MSHPALPILKQALPDAGLFATEFRGDTTVLVPVARLHAALAALKAAGYDFLSDVIGVDYLDYPAPRQALPAGVPTGRFGVVYSLDATGQFGPELPRLRVKALLDPSVPTGGIEVDPALELPSVCDLWPGAEWMEREVYDMFGIRFAGHPDLRRILCFESFPGHPLRKDYPLRGRGERENYRVLDRTSA